MERARTNGIDTMFSLVLHGPACDGYNGLHGDLSGECMLVLYFRSVLMAGSIIVLIICCSMSKCVFPTFPAMHWEYMSGSE